MSKNILIILPAVLKDRTGVHDNMDDKLIYPEIKAAQDMYIMPLLGSGLFNKILTDISTNTLAGNYKILVDDYLIDTVCNYVMSELPEGINYQFWNKGLASKTTENSEKPSMSDMYAIVSKYKNRAEHYSKRCRMYLMQNQNLFLEYKSNPGGLDVVQPEGTSYESPIYLGEDFPVKINPNYNA